MSDVYKAKQEWLEKVMASKLTPTTKVFAFGVFKHMYGEKYTSFPGNDTLKEATGLGAGHFSEYRANLVSCGALTITKKRNGKFKQEHCEYTLNLEWNGDAGTAPVRGKHAENKSTTPDGESPTPDGDSNAPDGDSTTPSGGANTTRNTSMEHMNEENNAPASAVAPSSLDDLQDSSLDSEEPMTSLEATKKVPHESTTPNGDDEIPELTWGTEDESQSETPRSVNVFERVQREAANAPSPEPRNRFHVDDPVLARLEW